MTTYSQKDPRWANLTYDGTNKFGPLGCFVTSLAMLCDKLPTEVAQTLRSNGCFTNGYINDSAKVAKLLGLGYHGTSTTKPNYDCIAETTYWGGQHFFVVLANGTRVDPLNSIHKNEYKIKSYRLFEGATMFPEGKREMIQFQGDSKVFGWIIDPSWAAKLYGPDWGKYVTQVQPQIKEVPVPFEVDSAATIKKLTDLQSEVQTLTADKEKLSGAIVGLNNAIEDKDKTIGELTGKLAELTPYTEEEKQVIGWWRKLISFIRGKR